MNEIVEIFKGDTVVVAVAVTKAGVPFPLSGYTCRFLVKTSKSGGSIIADVTANESDIVNNTFVCDLGVISEEVGNYYYEAIVSKVSPAFRKVVAQNEFNILRSIEE